VSKNSKLRKTHEQLLPKAPLLDKLTLYTFQRAAVQKMRSYISAFCSESTQSTNKTHGSGLVHMPTGTGKTAVIAALSQCIPEVNSVLVLCPRIILRNQLVQELQGNIFIKLSLPPEVTLKSVHCLADKQKDSGFLERLPSDAVIVTTVQKLHSLHRKKMDFFSKLISQVDLVIFDEGHYEPALHWSETIRHIGKPRIIFTATPFRNDLKLFDVDLEHTYSYSFHKAVSKSIIRGVEVTTVKTPSSPIEFVDLVIRSYESFIGLIPDKSGALTNAARIIIRCDDASQIRRISTTLREKGIKFVAIHEQFKDNDAGGTKWRHVPNPQETDAIVWIHQYKLIEGVDDWRFQLLAIYGKGPSSVRPMIQQIGRIIRNPLKEQNSKAYVLDTFEGSLKKQWSAYLEHDKFIERHGLEALDVNKRLQLALQEAQPPTLHIDRRFRAPFSIDTIKPEEDIQLPLRVNVFYREDNFNMYNVVAAILQEFKEGDRIIGNPDIADDRCLIASLRFRNSPFLIDKYFIEAKLCITLVRLAGRYVCFFDSENLPPINLPGFGASVAETELRRMLRGRFSNQIRQVSLVNSSVAPDSVQRRVLTTYSSIERTPPAFDDNTYVCRTAEGCIDRNIEKHQPGIRRYVGFSNARVCEGAWVKYHSFSEYHEWLDEVVSTLQGKSGVHIAGLSRYAAIQKPPSDTRPKIVVLDVSAVRDSYLTTAAAKHPNEPVDIIQTEKDLEVKKDTREFQVQANGRKCKVSIEYDDLHKKYRLNSPELDETYYPVDITDRGIIDKLNSEQAFRVIPEARGTIYAAGSFHDPKIGLETKYSDKHDTILSMIKPFPIFGMIKSEKGRKKVLAKGGGWEASSLFGVIDRVGGDRLSSVCLSKEESDISPFFQNSELLVCDDMGTELADFIMVQSMPPGRLSVVFIHCKALDPKNATRLSASGLANICSQAVKNIGELDPFSDATVNRIAKWGESWREGKLGTVNERIRKGPNNAQEAWEIFRSAVENPNAHREIWLFLGNMLSKQEFQNRLSNGKSRRLETFQALYELFSTLCTIRSRNTGFLIFCNP